MSHRWTPETAKAASRKGLEVRRQVPEALQAAYRKGYDAGRKSYQRYLDKVRQAGVRTNV